MCNATKQTDQLPLWFKAGDRRSAQQGSATAGFRFPGKKLYQSIPIFAVSRSAGPIRHEMISPLADDFVHNLASQTGESEVSARIVVCQPRVIKTKQVQNSCVEVVDMHGTIHDVQTVFVGCAVHESRLNLRILRPDRVSSKATGPGPPGGLVAGLKKDRWISMVTSCVLNDRHHRPWSLLGRLSVRRWHPSRRPSSTPHRYTRATSLPRLSNHRQDIGRPPSACNSLH